MLLVTGGGAQVVGMDNTFVMAPSRSGLTHLLTDTVAREIYFYDSSVSTIFKSSLQSGEEEVRQVLAGHVITV